MRLARRRVEMVGKRSLVLLLAMAALPAFADDRWDRDRYERDRYARYDRGRDGGWRQGSYNVSIVDRTMSDLRRIGSRNRMDGHERNHFERALYHLDRFRQNYARERRFDRSRLDDAIEHIADLSRARQIHPRDREVLSRDLYALRDFRSRGSGGGWW